MADAVVGARARADLEVGRGDLLVRAGHRHDVRLLGVGEAARLGRAADQHGAVDGDHVAGGEDQAGHRLRDHVGRDLAGRGSAGARSRRAAGRPCVGRRGRATRPRRRGSPRSASGRPRAHRTASVRREARGPRRAPGSARESARARAWERPRARESGWPRAPGRPRPRAGTRARRRGLRLGSRARLVGGYRLVDRRPGPGRRRRRTTAVVVGGALAESMLTRAGHLGERPLDPGGRGRGADGLASPPVETRSRWAAPRTMSRVSPSLVC